MVIASICIDFRNWKSFCAVLSSCSISLQCTSNQSRMLLSNWLHYSLSILQQIVSSVAACPCYQKMTAASWHLESVCEEDLDKF